MKERGDQLAEIASLIEQGQVRVHVDSVWTFKQVPEAMARSESGHAVGKVIIRVAP
jgi:alcohol dehydrogenase